MIKTEVLWSLGWVSSLVLFTERLVGASSSRLAFIAPLFFFSSINHPLCLRLFFNQRCCCIHLFELHISTPLIDLRWLIVAQLKHFCWDWLKVLQTAHVVSTQITSLQQERAERKLSAIKQSRLKKRSKLYINSKSIINLLLIQNRDTIKK